MKFQNPILNLYRTDKRTEARTDQPEAISPFNFFKVGGIIKQVILGSRRLNIYNAMRSHTRPQLKVQRSALTIRTYL